MIRFQAVSKSYPATGQEALAHIDLHLAAGEMAFLTGHSGAGKSTLLKLIGRLDTPTRGQLWVNGRNLNKLPDRQIPYHRRQVGMIFQDHRLLPHRTVYNNVALPLVVAGVRHQDIRRRVYAVLNKVGLSRKANSYPVSLSGGEQQRVGIARALVSKPPIVLADEPTGNLDPELSRDIMGLFVEFNTVGVTLLIATHDINLIRTMDRRIIHLQQGRVHQSENNIDKNYQDRLESSPLL
jgi:cell division transport system ATP-binding protein